MVGALRARPLALKSERVRNTRILGVRRFDRDWPFDKGGRSIKGLCLSNKVVWCEQLSSGLTWVLVIHS